MFRIILDDPSAGLDRAWSDARTQAALDLAMAEAHLLRVRSLEAALLRDIEDRLAEKRESAPRVSELLQMRHGSAKQLALLRAASVAKREEFGELRRLGRYRDEAEVSRIKALRRWIGVLKSHEPAKGGYVAR